MNRLLDKLNLRPHERRLVVIIGIVVFVVLNFLLVWPRFGDFGRAQHQRQVQSRKLRDYQNEMKRKPEYERELRRLESMGQFVATDSQALELQREVRDQAVASGVTVVRWDSTQRTSGPRTNSFFEEATLTVQVNTGEKELVDFLYHLVTRGSLIRVRSMSLGRDPSQMKLTGPMTFVESFQKKAPTRPAGATSVAAAGAAKAAATPPRTNSPAARPTGTTNATAKAGAPSAAGTNIGKPPVSVPAAKK